MNYADMTEQEKIDADYAYYKVQLVERQRFENEDAAFMGETPKDLAWSAAMERAGRRNRSKRDWIAVFREEMAVKAYKEAVL